MKLVVTHRQLSLHCLLGLCFFGHVFLGSSSCCCWLCLFGGCWLKGTHTHTHTLVSEAIDLGLGFLNKITNVWFSKPLTAAAGTFLGGAVGAFGGGFSFPAAAPAFPPASSTLSAHSFICGIYNEQRDFAIQSNNATAWEDHKTFFAFK